MDIYTESLIARIVYLRYKLKYAGYNKRREECNKSILIVRPEGIGDMVYTIPFLRELKRSFPEYKIDLVCSPIEENMMELCPYINKLFVFDTRTKEHRFKTLLRRSIRFSKENLIQGKYEMAIAPSYANPGGYIEAWLCFFSGAKRRIGMSEKVNEKKHKIFRGAYDIFFTDVLYNKELYHEVENGLNYIKYLGRKVESNQLELWTSQEDRQAVDKMFKRMHIIGNDIKIIVNLATSALNKDWPVAYYIQVSKMILKKYSVSFLLIGAGDKARLYADEYLRSIPNVYDFVNKTTMRQTIEIMKQSDLYLGGDTGPLHIAAACGLRGCVIYKNAQDYKGEEQMNAACWFSPWKSAIQVIQPEHALAGCEYGCETIDAHCILEVKPKQVYEELVKQINDISK